MVAQLIVVKAAMASGTAKKRSRPRQSLTLEGRSTEKAEDNKESAA